MYAVASSSMSITRLLKANSAPVASESVLRDCTKARESMTQTLGIMMPQLARRFGSHARNPDGVTNDTRMFVFQAFTHRRRSVDNSRQRPRRTSSYATAMTIPVLSSGMPCSNAYETASALPFRASCPFSVRGCSWIPLWSTPLLRLLVSSPALSCCSRTMTRRGVSQRRCINSLAMAHPTTPAPTMQTSYVFIWRVPSHPDAGGAASSALGGIAQPRLWQHNSAGSAPHGCP